MSTLIDKINQYKNASNEVQESTDFRTARTQFALEVKSRVSTFIGNVNAQWDQVCGPFSYALAHGMAFKDYNYIGILYAGLVDKDNGLGNGRLAQAIKEVSADFFGIDVGLRKKDSIKEGQEAWYAKGREHKPEEGKAAPRFMDESKKLECIKLLENGGDAFRSLLKIVREEKEEAKKGKEKKLSLTDLKANPNANKAVELAVKLIGLQTLTNNIEDLRIKRLVNELDSLLIKVNQTEADILETLAKSQASGVHSSNAA